MSAAAHTPIRMCIGCGTRAPQVALLRLASSADGRLAAVKRPLPRGRSAYLHAQAVCWERFAARGGRVRSLGRNVDKEQRRAFVQELKAAQQSAMMR